MLGMKWIVPVAAMAMLAGVSMLKANEAPASDQPMGTVTGLITDAEGNPVAEAKIVLRTIPNEAGEKKHESTANPLVHDEPTDAPKEKEQPKPKQDAVVVATAVTAADGTYTLQAPAGRYLMKVATKKKGSAQEHVNVVAGETATINLTLKAPPAPKEKNKDKQPG